MENKTIKTFKTNKTNEPKNKQLITDYEMNILTTNKIIEIIQSGNVKAWRKAWTTNANKTLLEAYNLVNEGSLSINIYTYESYNSLFIPSGFYLTFKQIKARNHKLRKGAKGTANYKRREVNKFLTRAQTLALEEKAALDEELAENLQAMKDGNLYLLEVNFNYTTESGDARTFSDYIRYNKYKNKYYYCEALFVLEYLYRAEDCGINIWDLWKLDTVDKPLIDKNERIKRADNVREDYCQRAKLRYREIEQDQAYYSSLKHEVVMPLKAQFSTSEEYYNTLFHELAHSTGHASLLNRKTLTKVAGFGSVSYSKEELVAELSSVYTMNTLNIATDETFENSIAYLRSWGNNLKESIKHNILNTIKHAQKATDLILNIKRERKNYDK